MSAPTTTVAVLGGDAAVARAVGYLIEDAGYAYRLLPDTPLSERLEEALAGVGLLLLAPALSAGRREALMENLREACGDEELPVVLELPWPCGLEELKTAIEKALGSSGVREGEG